MKTEVFVHIRAYTFKLIGTVNAENLEDYHEKANAMLKKGEYDTLESFSNAFEVCPITQKTFDDYTKYPLTK